MQQLEWQKGNESNLSSSERIILHQEWLKNIHKEIIEKLDTTKDSNDILTDQEIEKEKM